MNTITTTIHTIDISLSGQQMAQLILSIYDIPNFILIIIIVMSTTILTGMITDQQMAVDTEDPWQMVGSG